MKAKTLFILVLICTALGVYIHYGIEKAAEEKKDTDEKSSKLAKGDLAKIEKLTITAPGKSVTLEKAKNQWRIVSPITDLAAQAKLDTLTAALGRLKKIKVILKKEELESKKNQMADFGLDAPKLELSYKTSDLPTPVSFRFGKLNPGGTGLYTQVEKDGEIDLVSMDLDYLSTQNVDDYRDMRLITVDPNDFAEVEITRKKDKKPVKVKFKRDAKGLWTMTEPYNYPVDDDSIRSEIQKVGYIRGNSFLSIFPPSLKDPEIKILVGFKEGVHDGRSDESDKRPNGNEIWLSRTLKSAGKVDPKTKTKGPDTFEYYGKSDKTPPATVAQFHYDNFSKEPEDFIRKNFDFIAPDLIKKMILKIPNKADLIVSKTDKGYDVTNGSKTLAANASALDAAFRQIRSLHAVRFVPDFEKAPAHPTSQISIELTDGTKHDLLFNDLKDASELWYTTDKLKMRYNLTKEPLRLKEFDFEALTSGPAKPETQKKP